MKLGYCWTADFETTTDENDCRVWAFSICNIEDPSIFHYGTSINEFFEFIEQLPKNNKIWFHNLKFDGVYLLNYLLTHEYEWVSTKEERASKTFRTLITDRGQFYSITVYFKCNSKNTHKVEFFDSLKIFPNFSVERVAQGFNLPIRKLKIDYRAKRKINHQLTKQEIDYIRNDVEIMARALNFMFNQGHTKMTIAGDAMDNFKSHFIGFRRKFPLLPQDLDEELRKSYRGGFTYVNETWQNRITPPGIVLDVNSLYPSTMVQYPMPYGQPKYYEGKYQYDPTHPLFIQCVTCYFTLKPGKIPCVQLRNNLSFIPNEYVKSSKGKLVTLYLTKPDYELFREHYDTYNLKEPYGWKFKSSVGLFDNYINYWTQQKIKAGKEGNAPLRQLSKLMLNSIYGRYALSSTARQKAPYLDENGIVRFMLLPPETRETVYLPVASFVTAYGRNRTIRSSQIIKDYTFKKYGEDRYFYSDTDSIHASLSDEDLEELKDTIQLDDFKLGYWAKEAEFSRGLYIRQKCYIEEIDGKVHVTVAGLPKYLAPLITFDNFRKGFTTEDLNIRAMIKQAKENGASEEEIEKIQHKLTYKYVKGGVILADTDFTIK